MMKTFDYLKFKKLERRIDIDIRSKIKDTKKQIKILMDELQFDLKRILTQEIEDTFSKLVKQTLKEKWLIGFILQQL